MPSFFLREGGKMHFSQISADFLFFYVNTIKKFKNNDF